MTRIYLALALALFASAAEARSRVVVRTPPLVWFAQHVCTFVAWSVAPDWPAEQQAILLGNCPPRPSPRYG